MSAARQLHVVAAALIDPAGRILVAQRPPGSHLAGGWEFPGGKLEPGEAPLDGLARELREELGVVMGPGPHRPLRKVRHAYADREILIEAWLLRDFGGEPAGLDGQEIRWCRLEELAAVPLLAADAPIVDALMLPERLVAAATQSYSVVTRVPGKLSGAICNDAAAALDAESGGADFIVLDRVLPRAELNGLCHASMLPVFAKGIALEMAWAAGATGINDLGLRE